MKQALSIILFFIGYLATAQVSFDATVSRNKVALNERLSVEFKMNVDGDDFTPPNFEGFQVIAGPSQSISQSWVNGRSSMSKSFRYVLQPTKTGKLTIKHGVMTYEGRPYKTDIIEINVTGAVSQPKDINDNSPDAEDNVHLVAEVSNSNPYLNEPIRVVYKLYVKNNTGVSNWREVNSPKYADFWSQNIDNRNRRAQNGTYKGEPYRYLVLREAVLYPQKTGKLEIEPLTLDIDVQLPTNRRDFFGRPYMSNESMTVSAGSRTITVKDLPAVGRPASFTGAVGNFDFKIDTDRVQLQAGESLTASVEVTGKGNLKLMELPKLKVPQSLEVYEPERINNVQTSVSGMRGEIKDNYTIVPQFGGKYVIPPVEFSYFDPQEERYVTLNSGEAMIMVDGPAPASNSNSNAVAAGTPKNVIGSTDQFAFIKTDTVLQSQEKTYFFNSGTYWAILGGTFLLLPIVLIVRKQQERREADVTGNRLRTANKLSKKFLSAARKNIGNHEQFYIALERSLHNYLKSKLNIQTADMSKERVDLLLAEKGAGEEARKEFIELLQSCEFARYTPSTNASMKEDYDKAGSVLNRIDKQLKK
ncbi:BatD protein [Nonlabens spongiae]|uniref:BatD protein n=1 Tax=Nonlabens spongiae TaxID=331648 RepID=A0A1W6MKP7_9FLAO|nr:BatD family protein [Nonlabens spongiae]ARN78147.1 BatD protein [Nonlabens spongiae]